MSKVTIENPVINSPFQEPQRHFEFTDRGITEDIAEGRRRSEYFIPVPKPRNQAKETQIQPLPDAELREANVFINRVLAQVTEWRKSGYPGVTPTTKHLLEYWNNSENEPRLFSVNARQWRLLSISMNVKIKIATNHFIKNL